MAEFRNVFLVFELPTPIEVSYGESFTILKIYFEYKGSAGNYGLKFAIGDCGQDCIIFDDKQTYFWAFPMPNVPEWGAYEIKNWVITIPSRINTELKPNAMYDYSCEIGTYPNWSNKVYSKIREQDKIKILPATSRFGDAIYTSYTPIPLIHLNYGESFINTISFDYRGPESDAIYAVRVAVGNKTLFGFNEKESHVSYIHLPESSTFQRLPLPYEITIPANSVLRPGVVYDIKTELGYWPWTDPFLSKIDEEILQIFSEGGEPPPPPLPPPGDGQKKKWYEEPYIIAGGIALVALAALTPKWEK